MTIARVAAVFVVVATAMAENEFTVISWNVESGGADPDTVQDRIARFDGVDLWGLSEVSVAWADDFETGAEEGERGDFVSVLGNTGNDDRLLILYDRRQFRELARFEISWEDRYWYRSNLGPRSPLVVRLRHIDTGFDFLFMVNHLYRGDGVDPRRLDQAKRLREWANAQTLPVIAVGDYNFDFDLDPGQDQHNTQKGLGDMTACGAFEWLVPERLVTTHDSRYNSILDFVFVANAGARLVGQSRIIVERGDFPDTDKTPDHRPVEARFRIR